MLLDTIDDWSMPNDARPPLEVVKEYAPLTVGQFRRARRRLEAKDLVRVTAHEGEDFYGSVITERIRRTNVPKNTI